MKNQIENEEFIERYTGDVSKLTRMHTKVIIEDPLYGSMSKNYGLQDAMPGYRTPRQYQHSKDIVFSTDYMEDKDWPVIKPWLAFTPEQYFMDEIFMPYLVVRNKELCPDLKWSSEAIAQIDSKLNDLFRFVESQNTSRYTLKRVC